MRYLLEGIVCFTCKIYLKNHRAQNRSGHVGNLTEASSPFVKRAQSLCLSAAAADTL